MASNEVFQTITDLDLNQQRSIMVTELKRNFATAKDELSLATEELIRKVRDLERETLASLERTHEDKLQEINLAFEEAHTLSALFQNAIESSTQRSQSSDFKQRIEELLATEFPRHDIAFIKFTKAFAADLKLGFIETSVKQRPDAKRSTVEGLSQTLQAGVEAEFTLCPKTASGQRISKADLTDQVDFLIEPAIKSVEDVIIRQKEDSNIQLKFTPKVPGAYKMAVKINGDNLPTSPFTFQVNERELTIGEELDLRFFPGDVPRQLYGIAINTEGKVVITDYEGHCVYVFDVEGNCLKKIGRLGSDPGDFYHPAGVAFLNNNEILVADQLNDRIQQINIQTGTVVKIFGKRGTAKGEFKGPIDVCLDDEGRILVTEYRNHRIQVLSEEGESIAFIGDRGPHKLSHPSSCIPYKNFIVVSDRDNHCIKVFYQSGTFLYKFGKQGKHDGQFELPYGMLVDGSSNLVCDYQNGRVQQFSLDGHFRFTGKSVNHSVPQPTGIAISPDGRIFVTSFADFASKKVYILQ